jgi:hypothetical protein
MVSRMFSKVVWKNVIHFRSCQCTDSVIFNSSNWFNVSASRQFSTESENAELESFDEEENRKIKSLRNVSRLPVYLRNRMSHVMNIPECSPEDRESDKWKFYPRERFTNHQRRLFAKYGRDSGVDPGICWPSELELKQLKYEDRRYEPTLNQLWNKMNKKKLKSETIIKERYCLF